MQKKKEKQAIQEPTETQIFLHQQWVNGWKSLMDMSANTNKWLEDYELKRQKEKQDDLEALEQKEFHRSIFLIQQKKKDKEIADMLLNMIKKI